MIILYIAVAALVVLAIVIATRPNNFSISRSAIIFAPPEAIFAQVNDFHNWEAWSPWAKMDPNVKNDYSGAGSGMGAAFAWSGNNKVGAGRMDITESRPSTLIRIKLEFFRPMKAVNAVDFTFKPIGKNTQITWTMSGKSNFASKAFHLFINCDKMIGGEFERGLTAMKSAVEASARQPVTA